MFWIANEQVRPDFGGLIDQDPEDFLDGLLRRLDKEESPSDYMMSSGSDGPSNNVKSAVRELYGGETANRVGFPSIRSRIY